MTQEPEFNTSHPEYVPFSNAYIGHVMTGGIVAVTVGIVYWLLSIPFSALKVNLQDFVICIVLVVIGSELIVTLLQRPLVIKARHGSPGGALAATTDNWNGTDQLSAFGMGFTGGFVFGAVGGGVNQGMTASSDLAKETGKTASKLNNPWTRNYANDWITSNGADAISIGLDQKMSPEEKAQKMIQKVGINTIKSAGTAGAKTYGGNIKNARGESEAPGATLQTGTSGTVAADEQ